MIDKYFYKVCAAVSLALISIAVYSEYLADEYTLAHITSSKQSTLGAYGSLNDCEEAATYPISVGTKKPLSIGYVCVKTR